MSVRLSTETVPLVLIPEMLSRDTRRAETSYSERMRPPIRMQVVVPGTCTKPGPC